MKNVRYFRLKFNQVVIVCFIVFVTSSCASENVKLKPQAVENNKVKTVTVVTYNDKRQLNAELQALKLMDTVEVKAAQEKLRWEVYRPRAQSSVDRNAGLDNVLEEVAFAGALWTASNDPANSHIIWFNNPPHTTNGESIPGGRFGTDNPDRIYRYFPVDPVYRYEIHGRRDMASPPTQFFLEACEDKPAAWGYPLMFLYTDQIEYDDDGSFVVTVDSTPANGRKNHLQLPEKTAHVMVRDTLLDWANELPTQVAVRRVSGPQIEPISYDTILARVAKAISDQSFYGLEWEDHPVIGITPAPLNGPLNIFVRPSAPGQKAWGITGPGRFKIADDEAVVLTIEKQTAAYIGVQITDPWLISRDYIGHTTSLNNKQAWSNPDNTISYVIAKSDPGVHNWLDTVGINEVSLMLRMEIFAGEPEPETVLREVKVVKLAEFDSALPFDMPRISLEQRKMQLEERRSAYTLRVKTLAPNR